MSLIILGVESSCDDTSVAILKDGVLLSSVIASQDIHNQYGGVVPELASRAHQQNIVPVLDTALKNADITLNDVNAIAFTKGPGLMGSLLVGVSFVKGLSIAHNIPLVEVNHLFGHIFANYIETDVQALKPTFPFLSLIISGGHTLILKVDSYFSATILGKSIDDAAGEAFDKCAKVIGLPYPGGPVIDSLAKEGNPKAFTFAKPKIEGLDMSFSGLKTSFLYKVRDEMRINASFIEENKNDLCASLQETITDILINKIDMAVKISNIKTISLGGGVSANSRIREKFKKYALDKGWNIVFPEKRFTTDNAAMIALSGMYNFKKGIFSALDVTPSPNSSDLSLK